MYIVASGEVSIGGGGGAKILQKIVALSLFVITIVKYIVASGDGR